MARGKQPLSSKQAANNINHSNKKQPLPAAAASGRLRVQQPNALRAILTAAPAIRSQIKRLELVDKLPLKLYEELAACLLGNDHQGGDSNSGSSRPSTGGGFPCLQVLSLSGSCCGDAALLALLPALTHHAKLAVLDASGCCLSDAAGTRAASLLRAQAAAAAQEAWARTLRGIGSRRPSSARHQDSCRLLHRAEAGWQGGGASVLDCHSPGDPALLAGGTPATTAAAAAGGALAKEPLLCADRAGLQVVDLSNNQLTSATLAALAAALADEHSCISRLNLSHNPGLPAALQAAAVLLAAQQADPAAHRFTVELLQAPAPAAAAAAILAGCRASTGAQPAHRPTVPTGPKTPGRRADGQASASATGSAGSSRATVSRTRIPLAPRVNTSSSGASSSNKAGSVRRGAAAGVSAPTDAGMQLYAGVFVWDGLAAGQGRQYALPKSSPAYTGRQQQQQQQRQVRRSPGKAAQQQQVAGIQRSAAAAACGTAAAAAAARVVRASDDTHCQAGVTDSASGAAAAAAAVADQLQAYAAANTASIRSREAAAAAVGIHDTAAAAASQDSEDDSWYVGLAAVEGPRELQDKQRQQRRLRQQEEEEEEGEESTPQQLLLQELLFGLDLQGSAELPQQQQQQQEAPGNSRRIVWACDGPDTAQQQQQEEVLQPAIVLQHSVAELQWQLRQYQQWCKQQQQGTHGGSPGSKQQQQHHRKRSPTRQQQQRQQQQQQLEYTPSQSPKALPAQPVSGSKHRRQAPRSPPKKQQQQQQFSGLKTNVGRRTSSRQRQQQLQLQLSVQPGGGAGAVAECTVSTCAGAGAGGCAGGVGTAEVPSLPAELLELAQTMCVLTDTVAQLECLVFSRGD